MYKYIYLYPRTEQACRHEPMFGPLQRQLKLMFVTPIRSHIAAYHHHSLEHLHVVLAPTSPPNGV